MKIKVRNISLLWIAILFSVFLAGCAGKELQKTEGYTRTATSASARFYVPSNLKYKIIRTSHSRYVQPRITKSDHDQAEKDLKNLFAQIEQKLNSRLTDESNQSGIPKGDDMVIAVDVEEAYHNDLGPGAQLNVRVIFKDMPSNSTTFSFKFDSGARAFGSISKTADAFIHKIFSEINERNIFPQRPKR